MVELQYCNNRINKNRLLNFDTLAMLRKLNRNVSIIMLIDLLLIASDIISLYDNLTVSKSLFSNLILGKSYFSFNHRLILIRYLARTSNSSLRIGLNSVSCLKIKLSTSHLMMPKNINVRNCKIQWNHILPSKISCLAIELSLSPQHLRLPFTSSLFKLFSFEF